MNRYLLTALTFLFCGSLATATHADDLQEYNENPEPSSLVLMDIHGLQHSLEQYRGKVVLVNFWAGWCHPCIQEIPEMIRLAEMLADRPFVILAVNVGEEQRKLPGFVKRMDEHMVILMDTDNEAFKRWKGIGLPSTFVIDPGGRIRYDAYGAVNWDAPYIVTMLTDLMEPSAPETVSADNQ